MSVEEGNIRNRERKEMTIELAAMLKESRGGSIKLLNKIKHKFSLQEGLKMDTVNDYIRSFKSIGLVTIKKGEKKWKYNAEEEWELFRVEI